jgi:hypothetical protein
MLRTVEQHGYLVVRSCASVQHLVLQHLLESHYILKGVKLIQSNLSRPNTTSATVNARRLRPSWTTGVKVAVPASNAVIPQGKRQYLRLLWRGYDLGILTGEKKCHI